MLTELRVRDFAIIEALDIEFAPGLNVLTGETGAGKSIIVDCIALLLGDRAEANMVRAGAPAAWVEGVFLCDGAARAQVEAALAEHGIECDEPGQLTLAREVRANGRSLARVNGRAVSQHTLRALGELLVDVHGQSEHLSLLRVKEHVNLLDRYAGLWAQRQRVAAKVGELRAVRRRLDELQHGERERARRVDMLKFQIEEIRAARLKPGEEAALLEEHTRLANAEALAAYADEAHAALYESARGAPAALDLIAQAMRAIANLTRFDSRFEEYHQSLAEANAIIAEVARTLRDYRDAIEFNPQRLQKVEDRLELIKKLKRKYGETVEAVIAFAEQAEAELDQIEHSAAHIEALQQQAQQLTREIAEISSELSGARQEAAARLAQGVEAELQDLRMGSARFAVQITPQEPDATGADHVEFMMAPNAGEGLKPLAKIASGGEMARLMLALKATLSLADHTPTLIFDEIDQGIGGRIGTVVGQKLWRLARAHQVICITHLPQLASFGDAHFKVEKIQRHGRTMTAVRPLDRKARLEELAQMLGTTGQAGAAGAAQLLDEAEHCKATATAV
ncbi:MAG: DNA repair protein RecN [Chloroflexi bacterium]|uniref:DNA repair protein RecN n=1 Tax=Candidatus Thermofonsia Clade 3 bacterium TaxID=2364212 RepID=A0A2M8QEV4_9CHLR|nr:MAG: DNA repair protein RecN [Candidatus Thermofonsia Clade 3 bacterium]RMG62260.1 MAG: DNA repair protein RecN [Chloroflexota bacterium]